MAVTNPARTANRFTASPSGCGEVLPGTHRRTGGSPERLATPRPPDVDAAHAVQPGATPGSPDRPFVPTSAAPLTPPDAVRLGRRALDLFAPRGHGRPRTRGSRSA